MDQNNEMQPIQDKIKYDNIIYLIDRDKKTAEIIGYKKEIADVLIPRTITHESQEYTITGICENAFENSDDMVTIKFATDSKLHTIHENAFACSSFESIEIPSSVVNLEDKWCNEAINVTEIKVNPQNQKYQSIENRYIIGKTSKEKENFDVLVFVVRNIDNLKIPDFVEIIGKFAFSECYKIEEVTFESNSKLKIIDEFAFYNSSIKSITIPPHLTKICKGAFKYCEKLQEIKIPIDSELQIIEKKAFYLSAINSIYIPSKVFKLEEGCFNETGHLNSILVSESNQHYSSIDNKFIVGKSSNEKENFDVLLFSVRNIQKVKIPSSIEIIGAYAFALCKQITDIEIPSDSKLRIIGKGSFINSSITAIKIPPQLTHICESAFDECKSLQHIEIPQNSRLQTIESYSFLNTLIESIVIPSTVVQLKEGWCANTPKLKNIKVLPTNKFYSSIEDKIIVGKSSIENENYNIFVFTARNIQSLTIPDSIEIIDAYAFADCKSLHHIEFPKKLTTIKKYAFYNSSIDDIVFPSFLTQISEGAFSNCTFLNKISFSENSNLQLINNYAFSFTMIESTYIPSSVTYIAESAFLYTRLQIIEYDINSKFNLKEKFFSDPFDLIMLPTNLLNNLYKS